MKKYGVTSYTKTNECKEKIKNTFIMKYGVSHNTQSKEWQQKWYSNKRFLLTIWALKFVLNISFQTAYLSSKISSEYMLY